MRPETTPFQCDDRYGKETRGVTANWTKAQVAVLWVGAGERPNLIQGAGTQPRYAPSGHLVYAQGGSLMAAPFDPQRLEVTGTARRLPECDPAVF